MNNINKQKYELLGKWVAPTLAWALGSRWAEGNVIKKLGLTTISDLLILDGFGFYAKKAKSDIYKKLEKHIDPIDTEYFENYIKESENTFKDFLNLENQTVIHKTNWREALKIFFHKYEELWCPWFLAFFIGDFVEEKIIKLAKKYSINEEVLMSSIHSIKQNFSTVAKKEMQEIISFAKKNKIEHLLYSKDISLIQKNDSTLASKITDYIKKYEWIGTHHFWGNPYTLEKFFDDFKHTDNQIDEPVKLNYYTEDLKFLLRIAGDCAWMRLQAAESSAKVAYAYRPILNKAADQLKILYDDLIWLTHNEILEGLTGKHIISNNEIIKRKKRYGALLTPEKNTVFTGQKLTHLLEIFIPKTNIKKIKIIKGAIASKGSAKGLVKIVYVPHHVDNFHKGDILVAPETTPDYLPFMKIAGAIITDKGGITSHAAIVSRELKKPCIIGTKFATQLLKDDDLVEVDAEKGIVRIINK